MSDDRFLKKSFKDYFYSIAENEIEDTDVTHTHTHACACTHIHTHNYRQTKYLERLTPKCLWFWGFLGSVIIGSFNILFPCFLIFLQ